MGGWYWIGVAAGLGVAVGVLCAGLAGGRRVPAAIAALAGGAGAGYFVAEEIGAAVGGLDGIAVAAIGAPLVAGALARGGTRGATALLVVAASLVLAALAFVPALGYVLLLVVPVLALRLRRRGGERYAGLRILARD